MTTAQNPFVLTPYVEKDLFCDRGKELETLTRNCMNNANTTLISQRRIGKTGLILRLFDELKSKRENIQTIYLDIYSSRTLADFIKALAEASLAAFPEKSSIGKAFFSFLKSLRPMISYDPVTSAPQVQITYQTQQEKELTLQSILGFLDGQNEKILIAIDEFQQIREFFETNTEALLRSRIQFLKNVNFIFCGSKKHIMADIFLNAKMPFYSSTLFMSLEKNSGRSVQRIHCTYVLRAQPFNHRRGGHLGFGLD